MFDFLEEIQVASTTAKPKEVKDRKPVRKMEYEDRRSYPPINDDLLIPPQKLPEYEMPTGLELAMMLTRVGRPKPLCKLCKKEARQYHVCGKF